MVARIYSDINEGLGPIVRNFISHGDYDFADRAIDAAQKAYFNALARMHKELKISIKEANQQRDVGIEAFSKYRGLVFQTKLNPAEQ